MRFPIKITDNFLLEPILHTFGVKPDTSFVEIAGGALEVSMGIWFHERIPLDEITGMAPSEWPWWGGLGVKLHHHGVGVVGSTEGVVNLQLKTPFKMHVLFTVDATQLWISLADREAFLHALSQSTGVPIGEHIKF